MSEGASLGERSVAVHALVPFALLLAAASVFGRALAPSALGTVDGAEVVLLVHGVVAQTMAVVSTGLCGSLLVATAVAPRPPALRVVLVVLAALTLLVGLSAAGVVRVPPAALVLVAVTSGCAAVLAAVTGARRLPELVVGLAGLGAAVRLVAVHLAPDRPLAASTLAVVGLTIELALVVAAMAFAGRAGRRGLVVIALAVLAAGLALWIMAAQPESAGLVLVRHAIERLAPRPHPFGLGILPGVVAVLALVLAIGICLARRSDPMIVGALALAVIVRSQADVPLQGIALAAAALALFLGRAAEPVRHAAVRGTSPHPAASDRLAADQAVG